MTTEDCAELEEELTLEEVQAAIFSLKKGKCPRPNDIPAEIYKRYAGVLSPHVLILFLGAREEGSLPPDLRKACIVVIHKLGKPKDVSDSYRPISLLNIEVKIFATVLASQLLKVILSLVHADQTGFMPGRSIRLSLRRGR